MRDWRLQVVPDPHWRHRIRLPRAVLTRLGRPEEADNPGGTSGPGMVSEKDREEPGLLGAAIRNRA